MEPSRRRIPVWPFLILALGVGVWFFSPGGSLLDSGESAPSLEVPIDPGGTFNLTEARGHVTLLVFWATWCPACRQEASALSRVHTRIQSHGDRVVGVSLDDAPLTSVRAAATRLAMIYPIALGRRADADRFRVTVLPTAYVIAPDGTIADSFTGAQDEDDLLEAVERARQ
jgi:cytochrome c biogenesis protein CcmG, thiol:disulfide interchange protein DsbE